MVFSKPLIGLPAKADTKAFAIGATSNAMANMQVVTKKYGPAPVAYFAIPMVGGMFIDFFNAVLIAANIGWWT